MLASASPAMALDQTLNLREADIRAFIDDVAMLTGRTFIVDPRVTGRVTVLSNNVLSEEDVLDIFMATLSVHGFTAVPTSSGAYKIIPVDAAAQQASTTLRAAFDAQFVTEVFHLKTADPLPVLEMIKPLVHPKGQAVANRGGNAIIVVDTKSNMARIRRIIANLDTDTSVTRAVPLVNTSAREMADVVAAVLATGQGDAPRRAVQVVPVPSSNTLLLRGDAQTLEKLAATVQELDLGNQRKNDLKVIQLKHADAEQLLPILEKISASVNVKAAEGAPAAAPGSGRANIAFDKGTNSLIIAAEPSMQATLASMIEQLDVRRAQVLVEAIIVEVSDTAAKELGLQFVLAGTEGSTVPFTVTNYSNTAPNLLAITGAVALDKNDVDDETLDNLRETALNSLLGINGFATGFGGKLSDGTLFGAILTALNQDVASNVLSTPSVMTMNNEKASIIVGQEIPITTGESLGADNSNPFRTIDRQDVGVQLDVRPQITEGDTIKLFIRQEVSSIAGPVTANSTDLVTDKREIETTVLVDDGEIIVLGGLIENDERVSIEKIPLLGDIPLIGRAFRSEARSRSRTNLMVFLRPTIIRSAEDMRQATSVKYDYIRAEQLLRQEERTTDLDAFMRGVMGSAPGLSQGVVPQAGAAPEASK